VSEEEIKLARRRLCFKLAEDLDPGDEPYDIDKAAKVLEMTLPMTHAEADAEMEDFRKAKPMKPSIIVAFKEAMGCDKLEEALRRGVYMACQLKACKQVIEKDETQLAAATKATAEATQRAEAAERERDELAKAVREHMAGDNRRHVELEFELLSLRDEVARLTRPLTGENLRIDAAEVELRSEMLADEGEELTVPLRDYNELSKNALALDDEWRAKLTAAENEAKRLREVATAVAHDALEVGMSFGWFIRSSHCLDGRDLARFFGSDGQPSWASDAGRLYEAQTTSTTPLESGVVRGKQSLRQAIETALLAPSEGKEAQGGK
jgi:hypothetical protein